MTEGVTKCVMSPQHTSLVMLAAFVYLIPYTSPVYGVKASMISDLFLVHIVSLK